MSKRKIRITLLIAIPLLLVCGYLVNRFLLNQSDIPSETPAKEAPKGGGSGKGSSKPIPVTVTLAKYEKMVDGVRTVGSMVPNEEVELTGEVAGKIVQINFKEGSNVNKGDVLVQVNDDDLQAQLKRYEFQQENMRKKLERQRKLLERDAVSGEMFDQFQTEYNMLLADIELLKVKINRCSIKAPFSGTIGIRSVSEGSYLQVGSKIARLVDNNTLKLEFAIPEKYLNLPLVGSTVYFTSEADPLKRYTAKIYAMEPKLDESTRAILLRAMFDNKSGKFRPGLFIKVTIPTAELTWSLMIPTEAVVPAMNSKSVWVVHDGKPVIVPIETGTRLEDRIEVIKGLQEGDSVIITGLMQLREGATISVTN